MGSHEGGSKYFRAASPLADGCCRWQSRSGAQKIVFLSPALRMSLAGTAAADSHVWNLDRADF
jgi:hypothetical protein